MCLLLCEVKEKECSQLKGPRTSKVTKAIEKPRHKYSKVE